MEKRNYIIENFDVNSYFPFDKDYKVSNNLKFNRGVVGISKDGSIQEYILDFVPNIRHNVATFSVVNDLGEQIEFSNNPYYLGLVASENGILLIQYYGGIGLVYFPKTLTEKQFLLLKKQVESDNCSYEMVYNNKIIYDSEKERGNFIDNSFIINFASSIVENQFNINNLKR